MTTYILLFLAPKHLLASPPRSPDQARQSLDKWRSWKARLNDAGHEPTGAQLDAGGNRVTGSGKTVAHGAVGDELVMGGYFLVKASSLEEATELAKGCPLLDHGGTVEVRPLMG